MVTIRSTVFHDDGSETTHVSVHPGMRVVMTDDPALPLRLEPDEPCIHEGLILYGIVQSLDETRYCNACRSHVSVRDL